MQPAERARLIKLGECALNHLEKHRLRLKDAGQNGDIKKIWLAACAMHNDAEHLLVLGKILGEDGWHFTHTGASVAQILLVNHNLRPEPGMNDMAIQLWKDRQNMSTASANQANLADRLRQTPAQGTPLSAKPLMAWALDLWRVQGYDEMKKCEFCGEAGIEETVLQACGRCRITLYCDRECQFLHWKKVHKKECKGKAKVKKEATSGEGSGTQ